jgi:hypothetical protein
MYARIDPISGDIVEFPYNLRQLKEAHPNTSFPRVMSDEALARYNVVPVQELPKPVFNKDTHKLEQDAPYKQGLNYFRGWTIVNRSPAEKTELAKQNARGAFESEERQAKKEWSEAEKRTYQSVYDEYQRYLISGGAFPAPQLEEIKAQVYPSLTIEQIGDTIRTRFESYATQAAVALAKKIQAGD